MGHCWVCQTGYLHRVDNTKQKNGTSRSLPNKEKTLSLSNCPEPKGNTLTHTDKHIHTWRSYLLTESPRDLCCLKVGTLTQPGVCVGQGGMSVGMRLQPYCKRTAHAFWDLWALESGNAKTGSQGFGVPGEDIASFFFVMWCVERPLKHQFSGAKRVGMRVNTSSYLAPPPSPIAPTLFLPTAAPALCNAATSLPISSLLLCSSACQHQSWDLHFYLEGAECVEEWGWKGLTTPWLSNAPSLFGSSFPRAHALLAQTLLHRAVILGTTSRWEREVRRSKYPTKL